MKKKDFLFIISGFVCWRVLLFVFLFLAIKFLPLQQHFLGGRMENYIKNPWLWSWVNFDGEHYLALAVEGYRSLTYFFFPVFPMLNRLIAGVFNGDIYFIVWSGLFVSNISLILALTGFWKLIKLDYKTSTAKIATILLLIFSTSFYFGSYYTESLFLALVVWSFYFARKEKWLLASVLAGISSATRLIGIIMLPVMLIEFYMRYKTNLGKYWYKIIPVIFLSLSGFITYLYYLKLQTGDPLEFFRTVGVFGSQRSTTLVLLPQVFYRYIFKILPSLNYSYLTNVFTTLLEITSATLFLALSVYALFKLRASYAIYLVFGYLLPTLSGSFSSLPRYVLVLFPAFILLALWIEKLSRPFKIVVYGILFVGLAIASALFLRGYWVS